MNTAPYWASEHPRKFPLISRDFSDLDAVVIGGGITGITAAYQMKRAGLKVALLERDQLTHGDTGHTTAHLAAVTDRTFYELSERFGPHHAQAVWDAGFAAIHEIDETIRREGIDCDFGWTEGYLHTSLGNDSDREVGTLEREARLAAKYGFDAEYMPSIPGLNRPGVRFDHHAKFHPIKYARALADCIEGGGSHVFENSETGEISDQPGGGSTVKVGKHTIAARFVVIATHTPLLGKADAGKATLLQTDLYLYNTYAVRATVKPGLLPDGLFWDMADPYWYLRVDGDAVIFGGADHKTGQVADPRECYAQVERKLLALIPTAAITHRWSGQVIETRDGLPYMGETAPGQFAATGFSGNGMTFGTLAGMMARDAATGAANPWRELFDINRTRITKGLWDYVSENKDYPYYRIRDTFAGADGKSTRAVKRGEGKIIEAAGEKLAVYRSPAGVVSKVSAVCTHMGCLVAWNAAELSWDCPCHGSRFTTSGKVIGGPAETPLEKR